VKINRLLKEPLFHFLILGGLLYLASIVSGYNDSELQRIIVTESKIKHLEVLYTKTWQRKPSHQELDYLVQEYIKGQAAYYEGLKLGLDRDDIVISRRLRQKLDFIAEENTLRPVASDEILTTYLKQYADKYQQPPVLSIRQVYFSQSSQGDDSLPDINKVLTDLSGQPNLKTDELGDSNLFKPHYSQQTTTQLQYIFGEGFVSSLMNMKTGIWQGPVQSSFGLHLVYIEQKQDSRLPELVEIHDDVLADWENSQRQRSIENYYQNLLKRYPVTIHWPVEKENVTAK
jgi:hypothetical protein